MFGRRFLFVSIVVLMVVMGGVARPAIAAHQTAECTELVSYTGELMALGEQIDAYEETGPDMDALETWSQADYDEVIAFYDTVLTTLRGITPPAIAAEFHQTFLDGIGLFKQMLETMKEAGPFAILAFMQPIEELDTKLSELSLPLEEECNVALYDHDDDGEPEVGMGNAVVPPASASPVAPVAGETVPIGTTVQTSDVFSLTVVSVDPDALEAVQEVNPASVPPDGFQFVNVEIKLGHLSEGRDTFQLENLVVLGPTGVAYSAVNNSCGFVNGPLSSGEYGGTLTMTGHVCWVIASKDVAEGLRLYDASQPVEERVYLSLIPSSAGAADESPGSFFDAVKTAVPQFETPSETSALALDAKDIAFEPAELTIQAADTPVTITVTNIGAAPHNFSIDALGIDVDLEPGEAVDVVIPPGTAPGTYDFYCNVPGHKEAGMVGTLIVE